MSKIDEMRDEAVELFQQLIRIPSPNPPGDEKEIADFCAAYMRDMGMEVQQIEPFKRRVSNVGRLKGKARNNTLLFFSHIDARPPGDTSKLRFPPHEAKNDDGCIWGMGATNMKNGVAASLFAIKALKESGVQLDGDVLLVEGSDELGGGYKGLHALIEKNMIEGDWAIYTEAHPRQHMDEDRVEIGSRGMVIIEITVHGRRAHTGQKDRGLNAILKMLEVAKAVDSMEFKSWEPHPTIKFGDKESPLINVSLIKGGNNITQVPEICVIKCDCRTLPGQTGESVKKDLQRVICKLMDKDPELKVDINIIDERRAWFIDPEAFIVKSLQQAIKEVTGELIPVSGVPSTSDARFITLDLQIPICKFTFGDILGRRQYVDEYQDINRYINTIKVYATLMLNLLSHETE